MNIIRATESAVHSASGLLNETSMNVLSVFIFGALFITVLMWVTNWFEKNVNLDGFIVIVVICGGVMLRLYFFMGAPTLTF